MLWGLVQRVLQHMFSWKYRKSINTLWLKEKTTTKKKNKQTIITTNTFGAVRKKKKKKEYLIAPE